MKKALFFENASISPVNHSKTLYTKASSKIHPSLDPSQIPPVISPMASAETQCFNDSNVRDEGRDL